MSERYDPNYFGQALQSFSSAMASPYSQIIQQKMAAQEDARKRGWRLEDIAIRGGVDVDNQGGRHYVDLAAYMESQARLSPEMLGYTVDANGFSRGNADITNGGIHPDRARLLNASNTELGYHNWNAKTLQEKQRYRQLQNGNPFNAYRMSQQYNTGAPGTYQPTNVPYNANYFKLLGGMPYTPLPNPNAKPANP